MKTQPEQIARTVNKIMENINSTPKPIENRVLELWPGVAGERIGRHTRPIAIKNGRLIIHVDGSSWLYELSQRHKKRLLKKLQKKLGAEKLVEIRFRIGETRW
jgi:predicted nucleic acid-binding Zn ribbon protein